MSTTFDPTLTRNFKRYVLAALRRAPGWEAYYLAQGWKGRTNKLSKVEINQACVALGVDKRALYDAFKVAHAASPVLQAGVIAGAIVEGEGDEDESEDESESEGDAVKHETESASASASSAAFEGRDAKDVIEEALRPASVHLTPYLQSELPKLLASVAQAAVQGPRVERVEVVKRVPVASAGSAGAIDNTPPVVNVVARKNLRDVFELTKREGGQALKQALDTLTVPLCDYFDAPGIDPNYIWSADLAAHLGACDASTMNLWLAGHAGVGKTEGVKQYAARLYRPFIRIPIDRTTEKVDLIGQMEPTKDGGAAWRDNALTKAFRTPYAIVLIDEPTLLRSGTLAFLQTALDTRTLHLPTGEVVDCADGVLFVAADNTLGTGDETGRYVDTSPVNHAFLDRFALRLNVAYLAQELEAKMLSKRSRIPLDAATIMVDYATLTRDNARSGKLTVGLTPRRLLAWGTSVALGIASARAWENAVINGSDPTDIEPLRMLEATTLRSQHATIDALARGLPAPAPDPAPSAIGERFPVDEASSSNDA